MWLLFPCGELTSSWCESDFLFNLCFNLRVCFSRKYKILDLLISLCFNLHVFLSRKYKILDVFFIFFMSLNEIVKCSLFQFSRGIDWELICPRKFCFILFYVLVLNYVALFGSKETALVCNWFKLSRSFDGSCVG